MGGKKKKKSNARGTDVLARGTSSHLYSAWGPGKGGDEGRKEACIVALFFSSPSPLPLTGASRLGGAFEHGQGRGRKADSRPAQLVGREKAERGAASQQQASSIFTQICLARPSARRVRSTNRH